MKRIIPWIFLFALALRFSYGMHRNQPIAAGGDSQGYLQIAESLGESLDDPFLTRHPPVYPLFVRLAYVVTDHSTFIFLLLQSLVAALCVPFAFQLGKALYSERVGLLAACWIAIDPFQIYYSGVILSETLFTTLLLISVALTVLVRARQSSSLALGAGIALGLTTLCRGLLFPVLPFFMLFVWIGPRAGAVRRTFLGALLLAGILLPMGIWSGFVHHLTGRWMLLDSHKGESLYWGLNPHFDRQEDIDLWVNRMGQEMSATGITDPIQMDLYWLHRWERTIRDKPMDFCRLMTRKFVKFWRVVPYQSYFPASYRLISAGFMIPFTLFFLIGFIDYVRRAGKGTPLGLHLLIGFILTYTFLNVIIWTQVRYRVPLHPLLAILAGYGITLMAPGPERARLR